MPYIKDVTRQDLIDFKRPVKTFPRTPGELNFVITSEVLMYLSGRPSYADYNEIVGVLECVKLEFYRRAMALYEDRKCEENGDVYS